MTKFLKMHGLGNDFAVFDARKQHLAVDTLHARAIADRRTGIGCDQVIVIAPAMNGADAAMRIFNADGGEVEACGNAARCVAQLLLEEKHVGTISLETAGGRLVCAPSADGLVSVDMGPPKFGWKDIPLAHAVDPNAFMLEVDGRTFEAAAVSVGNPHCVLFTNDAQNAPVAILGPKIEIHAMFPERTNVEFATVLSRSEIRMRVWERGAGITRACGTGACATAVTAIRRGLCDESVSVLLDGGTLGIVWQGGDSPVRMTGPVARSFSGEIDLEAIGA
jgi:diaminopimelate epimerase